MTQGQGGFRFVIGVASVIIHVWDFPPAIKGYPHDELEPPIWYIMVYHPLKSKEADHMTLKLFTGMAEIWYPQVQWIIV